MKEPHLTPMDVEARWATTLKIGAKTLANWRIDPMGRGPDFKKIGGRILYPLSSVEHFEDTGENRAPKGGYRSQIEEPAGRSRPSFRPAESASPMSHDGSQSTAVAALEAELRALDLRRARVALHYRSQLQRSLGRVALRNIDLTLRDLTSGQTVPGAPLARFNPGFVDLEVHSR